VAVKLRMPPILRPQVGGAREVEATGETLGDVLDDLLGRHPSLRDNLLDADGNLNRFVNIYVANEDVRLGDGLATVVPDGSTVIVLPAMAGGTG
jgi:sulfur-carrier protein